MAGPRPQKRSLIMLLLPILNIITIWGMLNDLKAITGSPDFSPIMVFLPCINIYYLFVKIPAEVAKAKQMTACTVPPRGIVWYLFGFGFFALLFDMNDMAA